MDMCSETDSTNECSDFKSELEEEDEHGNGAGGRNASGQHAHGSSSGGGGGPAGPGGPSVPRKSSGLSSKRTGRHPRVVFV